MLTVTLERLRALTDSELVAGPASTEVRGLADDSRHVQPGDLFFCMPGAKVDGARFAADAVEQGAVAVVVPEGTQPPPGVPALRAADCRAALSCAVREMAREAIGRLTYAGVTGTNGKTTTTCLTAAVLRAAGRRTAIVGTLGTLREDGSRVASKNTTPGPLDLLHQIEALAGEGYTHLAMEVSSQAVVQHRADFLPFAAAVWTNLSPEHFELHGDLDTYRAVKVRYLAEASAAAKADGRPFAAVVNLDDPSAPQFLAAIGYGTVYGFTMGAPVVSSFSGERVEGREGSSGLTGGRVIARWRDQRAEIRLQLGGGFNLQNALAAACVGLSQGIDLATSARGLAGVERVPGRFQPVPSEKRQVLIDYAHTSEGMENLLKACRPLVAQGGRLIVVFGCGGDRDNSKRPRMGRSAAAYADFCVITNDNPRTEDPARITGHILEGIDGGDRARCVVEHDRRRAIGIALEKASPHDLVVVAGKGHEDYQLVGDRVLHFDDYEVVKETLERL